MKIGKKGEAIIKQFEELRLEAYIPVPGDVPTIGWGTTKGVKMGDSIDWKTAELLFENDIKAFENCVENAVHVPLTQNQNDACVSLAYNIGCNAFENSTLVKCLNLEKFWVAADEFLKWNKFKGEPLKGLTRRREAERSLFLDKT
jgi:lysozyme